MVFFPLFNLTEQNESKHDGSPSPGMTDQEKEVAASAYEAFVVNQRICKHWLNLVNGALLIYSFSPYPDWLAHVWLYSALLQHSMVERGVLERGTGAHTHAQTLQHSQQSHSIWATWVTACCVQRSGRVREKTPGASLFLPRGPGQAGPSQVQHLSPQNVQGSFCDQCDHALI